jgi:hypothetical protein
MRVFDYESTKEMCVARGTPPFIMKAGVSPIPSPITKVRASLFMSPIPNIERRALQRNISISYAPYKAHSQLGQNSSSARSALFLPCSYRFFPFLKMPSKNLAMMN